MICEHGGNTINKTRSRKILHPAPLSLSLRQHTCSDSGLSLPPAANDREPSLVLQPLKDGIALAPAASLSRSSEEAHDVLEGTLRLPLGPTSAERELESVVEVAAIEAPTDSAPAPSSSPADGATVEAGSAVACLPRAAVAGSSGENSPVSCMTSEKKGEAYYLLRPPPSCLHRLHLSQISTSV